MSDEIILTLPRDKIFFTNYFQGFKAHQEDEYISRVLKYGEWHPKKGSDDNFLFKQPIAYSLIVNPAIEKVFSYQRAKKSEHYAVTLLQGKWSWGIGGHISKIDEDVNNGMNIIERSFMRELGEEVGLYDAKPKILGYINDDLDNIGKVHFGLLYLVETDKTHLVPNDPEITNGEFRTISELEDMINNKEYTVEGWSKIALEELKKII